MFIAYINFFIYGSADRLTENTEDKSEDNTRESGLQGLFTECNHMSKFPICSLRRFAVRVHVCIKVPQY